MTTFRDAVRQKDFSISAELFLRPESNAESITAQTALLRDHVDGILLTDNQAGRLHLSTVAAASVVLAAGGDPIVQLSTRNRNRVALFAELLGAAAIGVSSVQLVRGRQVPDGFEPRPKAVLDVDVVELLEMASRIKQEDNLEHLPELFLGSVLTVHRPKPDWTPRKLLAKADAGAQFVLSGLCMNTDVLRDFMRPLVAAGVPRRLNVFVTLAVLGSADDARFLRDSRRSHMIPEVVIARLDAAADPEAEGIAIAAEQLRALADIPGVRGAHLIATRKLASITAAIDAARNAGLRRGP